MNIDPSTHRPSFVSAAGVSAKAAFLSALPVVLRGVVTVFASCVEHFNLELSCLFHVYIRIVGPYMVIVYTVEFVSFKWLVGDRKWIDSRSSQGQKLNIHYFQLLKNSLICLSVYWMPLDFDYWSKKNSSPWALWNYDSCFSFLCPSCSLAYESVICYRCHQLLGFVFFPPLR